jgi:hypothetical protein
MNPCKEQHKGNVPVRERRCIFAAACFAALAAFVVPTMFAVCLLAEDGADEEDMDSSCTLGPATWFMKASNAVITTTDAARNGRDRKGQDGRVRPGCS